MENKLLLLGIYVAAGIALAILPSASTLLRREKPPSTNVPLIEAGIGIFTLCIASFAVICSPHQFSTIALVGFITFVFSFGLRISEKIIRACSITASYCVCATLLWWLRDSASPILSWLSCSVISILLILATNNVVIPTKFLLKKKWYFDIFLISAVPYVAAAALFSYSTGIYNEGNIAFTAWHHWGAYVGPAQAMRAGAILFKDIPAQYGFGPTVSTFAACARNCWEGIYFIAASAVFIYGLLIAFLSRKIVGENVAPGTQILLVVGAFASAYLWSSYPPLTAIATFTPSVSGLRFLPPMLLVAYIALANFEKRPRGSRFAAHCLWILNLAWAPETAFYGSFIWCPIYLWLNCLGGKRKPVWQIFIASTLKLLTILLGVVIAGLFAFWLMYRTLPSVVGYFAYMMHPPGDMAVNYSGAILFLLTSLTIGSCAAYIALKENERSKPARQVLVLLLASYACSSYFLGRSHDNNILNILPFIFLLLIASKKFLRGRSANYLIQTFLVSIAIFPIFFNWSSWKEAYLERKFFEFNPSALIASLSLDHDIPRHPLTKLSSSAHRSNKVEDILKAANYIDRNYHESVTLIDQSLVLLIREGGPAWSAIHGPANFTSIPPKMRRHFITETMHQLHKPGWLLIAHSYTADGWIDDFNAVYRRDISLEFGSYYAIRYLPR